MRSSIYTIFISAALVLSSSLWADPPSPSFTIFEPQGEPVADFIYNLGMGDTPQSHAELFKALNAEGIRVIVPDYPKLSRTTIGRIADTNRQVEKATRQDVSRPLLIGGWSMGGLVAYRMLQDPKLSYSERNVAGVLLYAPATHPRYFIGNYRSGILTTSSISNNPNPPNGGKMGIPVPALQVPAFLVNLLYHAHKAKDLRDVVEGNARAAKLLTVPIIVFNGASGGINRDRSVDPEGAISHFNTLKIFRGHIGAMTANPQSPLVVAQFDAPHALTWELDPVGREVRDMSAAFAKSSVAHSKGEPFCLNSMRSIAQSTIFLNL